MCKMSSHTMIRVEMSLQEAQDIIVDPDIFVTQLQDMLPAAPLDMSPQAKGARENNRRKVVKAARRGGWKLPTRHCDVCDRDIAESRWEKHQLKHAA